MSNKEQEKIWRDNTKNNARAKGHCPRHTAVKVIDGICFKCENNKIHRKEITQERLTNNICRNHKDQPIVEDRTCCQICIDEEMKRRSSRKESGKCIHHPDRDVKEGLTGCEECVNYDFIRSKIRREDCRTKKICQRHYPEKWLEGRRICQICINEYQKNSKEKRAAGLCPNHLIINVLVAPGLAECVDCNERSKISSAKAKKFKKDNDRCRNHINQKTDISGYCEECWFRLVAKRHLDDANQSSKLIELLEEQDYKCYYTGIELIPGINASIDHLNPKSKGGLNEIHNLRWVDLDVNIMKREMYCTQFINCCKGIINYQVERIPLSEQLPSKFKFSITNNINCRRCKKVNKIYGNLCEFCYFYETASGIKNRGNGTEKPIRVLAQDLKDLFYSQNTICPYTGIKLVPAKNASIDHILPVTRGGLDELDNLQWIDYAINVMKYNKNHKEFIDICAKVSQLHMEKK